MRAIVVFVFFLGFLAAFWVNGRMATQQLQEAAVVGEDTENLPLPEDWSLVEVSASPDGGAYAIYEYEDIRYLHVRWSVNGHTMCRIWPKEEKTDAGQK